MAQTRLKSGNLHMVGGDNGTDGDVLKSKGDGTMEWGVVIINPTFSSFDYPGDDTALDPAGGQSLVINGGGFNVGVTVTIDGTTPSSITRNSAQQLTVTTPAKSAGSQAVVITNTDGGSASTNVSYNGIPAFTNAAGSLGSVKEEESINFSAAATEPDGGTITYAITSGALPSGVSLNTLTGAITGTAPSVSADTTSNFTVTATDNENQSTARAYSITVTPILPSDSFTAVTYTGNGGTQAITSVGFKPDLVWIKNRDSSVYSHYVTDSTRGAGYVIIPNDTIAETYGANRITSFGTGGFTLGNSAGFNNNGDDYVAWCWKANGGTTTSGSGTGGVSSVTHQVNNDAGFSLIQFVEGTGTTSTVTHGLSSTPELVISKKRGTNGQSWFVWHKDLSGSQYLQLNSNAAVAGSVNVWNNTAPTSTSISFGPWLTESDDYGDQTRMVYAFHSVTGFSKFDSYTGNGSANGPIVETGFEPAFLMIKRTDTADNWSMTDNTRNTANPRDNALFPNLNSAELTSGYSVDYLSNGFQIKSTDNAMNANGGTYIYIAFAADPDTTLPTLADSFNTVTYTGNGSSQSITGLGFKPNLVWLKSRSSTYFHSLVDSVRGAAKPIFSNSSSAETTDNIVGEFLSDGFTTGTDATGSNNGSTYVAWAFKADDNEPTINTEGSIDSIVSANANAGFSIVTYTGAGGVDTVGHGLSAQPELMFIKNRGRAGTGAAYATGINQTGYLFITTYGSESFTTARNDWMNNDTPPTSSLFTVRSYNGAGNDTQDYVGNYTGDTYVAYCFHSVSGYSKIGSYTGTGSSGNAQNIGFQPDWVMFKNTSSTGGWWIYDSVRGDNKRLFAEQSAAESTSTSLTINSTGFSFNDANSNLNASGNTYIYMAIKIN